MPSIRWLVAQRMPGIFRAFIRIRRRWSTRALTIRYITCVINDAQFLSDDSSEVICGDPARPRWWDPFYAVFPSKSDTVSAVMLLLHLSIVVVFALWHWTFYVFLNITSMIEVGNGHEQSQKKWKMIKGTINNKSSEEIATAMSQEIYFVWQDLPRKRDLFNWWLHEAPRNPFVNDITILRRRFLCMA